MTTNQYSYQLPLNSAGVGLRSKHLNDVMESLPNVGWFELLTDNHLVRGGRAKAEVFAIREHYPTSLHCVNMSIGSTDHLNWNYFKQVKQLASEIEPWVISDHLCWTSVHGQYSHELLPLPYNDETVTHVAQRISQIQDFLGRSLAIENVSTYLNFHNATLSESEFLAAVVAESDCDVLFDVNNIYVSHHNTGEDIDDYLKNTPWEKVVEMHLAGFETREMNGESFLLDTHSRQVHDEVWNLYKKVLEISGPIPTLIEWDSDIPEWPVLFDEMKKVQTLHQPYLQPS